jgi:hypothetical protein
LGQIAAKNLGASFMTLRLVNPRREAAGVYARMMEGKAWFRKVLFANGGRV